MTCRSSLLVPISTVAAALAAVLVLGACAGGPLEPPASAVKEASYVCDNGGRLTARFEYGSQRILFVGGADLDGRDLNVPKNTLVLIPAEGEPLRMVQGPPATSAGFYYRADGGFGFAGEGDRATLTTPSGMVACRLG